MTDPVEVTAPSDPLDPEMEVAILTFATRQQEIGIDEAGGFGDSADGAHRESVAALRSAIRSALASAREEGRKAGIEEMFRRVCVSCFEGSPVEWRPASAPSEYYRIAGWHHRSTAIGWTRCSADHFRQSLAADTSVSPSLPPGGPR